MENKIESIYGLKIDDILKNLKIVEETIGNVDDAIGRTGKSQSFGVLAKQVENYNRVLANGESIYRKIEGGAKAYTLEVQRLQKAEKELIKTQAEFKSSADYDEAEKNLMAVRKRMQELNAEIDTGTNKSKSSFSSLGNVVKTAGLAIATYFTIDKLTDIEGQIIENTKAYEKYYAVLKNGFQDENKATEALAMIYEFASETPYAVDEITQSFIKLNNRGFTPTKEEMVKLGDIAASQGKSFDQLTEAVLDAMTGEFERLKEFGITAKTVGDNVTLSFKGQEVTVNKFNQGALKEAVLGFGELKGVTGSMAAVSRTLEGEISNLGDSWAQLLTSLGQSQGFLSGIISTTKTLIDTLKSWVDVPIERKLTQENAELNMLARSLVLANDNEAVRGKLLTEISQKYPSFLTLLGKEADNTYAIESALKLVNEQYRIKLRLAGLDVLSKRNAESQADIIESEMIAYQKAEKALERYGYKVSQFQALSEQEQQKAIQRIKDNTKDTGATSTGFGGIRLETGLKEKAVAPFLEIIKLTKQQAELDKKSFDLEAGKARLNQEVVDSRKNAVEAMKKENETLAKGLITQKEYNAIIAKGKNINGEQQAQKNNFQKFEANKEQILTFAKQGQEPPKVVAKVAATASKDKVTLKETKDELEKLFEQEKKYLDATNKAQLESENVRLSLLDKSSNEYIDKKKAYDLKVIEQEKEAFKELYRIQVANQLLKEDLEKKGSKISEIELEKLKENAEKKSFILVNGDGEQGFEKSKSTVSQREILRQKTLVIEQDYKERLAKIQTDSNKEQIKRIDFQNNLLGDGLNKQIALIESKYQALIETYKNDLAIIAALELKRAEDIAKATFEGKDKDITNNNTLKKDEVNLQIRKAGESEIEFEKRKKAQLLALEVDFYKAKLALLQNWIGSDEYKKAKEAGLISKEEDDSNQQRVKNFQVTIAESEKILGEFRKSQRITAEGTGNLFKDFSTIFEKITGKILQFSKDPEANAIITEQLDKLVSSTQQAMSNILQINIAGSEERIGVLDTEINERQGRADKEYESFKLGLANNFLEEKKALDAKKKEREAEVENKKKLQEKAALIDSLSVISSNAVTIASTISSVAKTFEAHSAFPFIGIISALAGVATIIATISSIGARAKSATKFRFGGGLTGNLHEAGGIEIGNTGIFAEGGEFITRREQTAKSPKLFESLNDNTFGLKGLREQHELLKPFGFKLAENRERTLRADVGNKEKKDRYNLENALLNRHFGNISDGLKQVAENTAKISDYDYVQNGDETLKFNKKGKIVEIIKKTND